MADETAAREWVLKVLGIDIGAPAYERRPEKLLPIWIAAKEEADSGIEQLARALRGYDDPDLERIAEFGLNGVTDKRSVGLMVALREADAGAPGAGKKLDAAVQAFRSFLDGDPIVDLIDDNPFDVSVDLRATLGRALDRFDAAMAG